MKTYSKRLWLNGEKSPSTGSVVAFSGKTRWNDKMKPKLQQFLEVSDCQAKVRLHQCFDDTNRDYLKKIKRLKYFLADYIDYLEGNL